MSIEARDIETLKQIVALRQQIIELYVDEYYRQPNFQRIRDEIYEKIEKLENLSDNKMKIEIKN